MEQLKLVAALYATLCVCVCVCSLPAVDKLHWSQE